MRERIVAHFAHVDGWSVEREEFRFSGVDAEPFGDLFDSDCRRSLLMVEEYGLVFFFGCVF